MENLTNETVNIIAENNPQLFMRFSIVAFSIAMILLVVFTYYKYIKPAVEKFEIKADENCVDCDVRQKLKESKDEVEFLRTAYQNQYQMTKDQTNLIRDVRYQQENAKVNANNILNEIKDQNRILESIKENVTVIKIYLEEKR